MLRSCFSACFQNLRKLKRKVGRSRVAHWFWKDSATYLGIHERLQEEIMPSSRVQRPDHRFDDFGEEKRRCLLGGRSAESRLICAVPEETKKSGGGEACRCMGME